MKLTIIYNNNTREEFELDEAKDFGVTPIGYMFTDSKRNIEVLVHPFNVKRIEVDLNTAKKSIAEEQLPPSTVTTQ